MKNGVIFCLLVLLSLSCAKKLTTGRVEVDSPKESIDRTEVRKKRIIVESFEDFYEQFHRDADFQMQRVRFPLEGTYEDATGVTQWEKSNWIIHQQKVTDITEPNYDTEIIRKDDLVIDKVRLKGSGYFSERKFKLINGKWYLVYYDAASL